MNLRRQVELVRYEATGDNSFDLPDGARIVAIDFHEKGGLRLHARAVWVEVVTERYDEDTGRAVVDSRPP